MKQYKCMNCGKGFRFDNSNKPNYCPICGGTEVHTKIEETVQKELNELVSLADEFRKVSETYVELYCKIRKRTETLRVYASRGKIDRSIIPIIEIPNLTKEFYKSRKK